MSGRQAAPEGPVTPAVREQTGPSSAGAGANRARLAPGEPDDHALVARAKEGDAAAFRRLVERHQRRIYQLALSIVKEHEEALDVVQEAFVKVHQNLPGFKGDAAFFTWAYRITYNLAIDAVRKTGRGEKVAVEENTLTDEGAQFESYGAGSQSPQAATLRGELSRELERALATLSENHRAILLLREVDGLSYEELAEVLKVPKGTVMSRLFHARHKMQAALKGYVQDEPESDPEAA